MCVKKRSRVIISLVGALSCIPVYIALTTLAGRTPTIIAAASIVCLEEERQQPRAST